MMEEAKGEEADKCEAEIRAVLEKYGMEFHSVEIRVDGKVQSIEMKLFRKT